MAPAKQEQSQVFFNSPHRKTPKNAIQKSTKIGFGFCILGRFFCATIYFYF
jgi:hypothetical protein